MGVEEGTYCALFRVLCTPSLHLVYFLTIINHCPCSSSNGANNLTHVPFVYEIDGGGGGGSSYGGGCDLDTYFNIPG
jgi:hypothetical protein